MAANTNKGFGLLFEMGCGKTRTAIASQEPHMKRRDPESSGNRTNVRRVGLAKRDRRGRRLQSDLQSAPGNEATKDPND